MEKLKVGDTVRLKEGLVVGEVYDKYEMLRGMNFSGTKTILEVTEFSCLIGIFYYPFSIIERVEPC